jgi:hypothetical protein
LGLDAMQLTASSASCDSEGLRSEAIDSKMYIAEVLSVQAVLLS